MIVNNLLLVHCDKKCIHEISFNNFLSTNYLPLAILPKNYFATLVVAPLAEAASH